MAYDNRIGGRIVVGIGPVKCLVYADEEDGSGVRVKTGDVLAYKANFAGDEPHPVEVAQGGGEMPPVLVAGEDAEPGESLTAYLIAVVGGRYSEAEGMGAGSTLKLNDGEQDGLVAEVFEGEQVGMEFAAGLAMLNPAVFRHF